MELSPWDSDDFSKPLEYRNKVFKSITLNKLDQKDDYPVKLKHAITPQPSQNKMIDAFTTTKIRVIPKRKVVLPKIQFKSRRLEKAEIL